MAARVPDAAIYRQIAAIIRARIADGTLQPGQRVGSMETLAYEHDVGEGTIRRVMNLLRFEGLVVGKPGEVARVREIPEQVVVAVVEGGELTHRLPTEAECAELGVAGGVWVAVLSYGDREWVYAVDRTKFTFGRSTTAG